MNKSNDPDRMLGKAWVDEDGGPVEIVQMIVTKLF